ncbi:carbohydrate porin [Oscillatoriales cyanobacterium LEGE 11467]|uniref:Carbohydrate porin n=1 Tax=Zarconia navalis LEGE 11467 TaxID=1828826 RepID=A0A928W066_9CYAN|nr:iron uptake porin [Zarconia navalis]MBE9040875.1 carbohydrate porin [Zarconia navalis LEGE 11467]
MTVSPAIASSNVLERNFVKSAAIEVNGRTRSPKVALEDSIENRIPSVDRLSDVQPTDWAFEALKSLVERYGCVRGDGDGRFRGNEALTRFEFAAALNLCLDRVVARMGGAREDSMTAEDMVLLRRLQAEFASELTALQGRMTSLEARASDLEATQFSTTTVLRGDIDFRLTSAFGDRRAVSPGERPTDDIDSNLTLGYRANLAFDTSFTGRDRLRTQFVAGNLNSFASSVTGTEMTRIGRSTDTENSLRLNTLFYEFPVGDRTEISIAALGDYTSRILPNLSPVSSISNFGSESSIFSRGFGSGFQVYHQFSEKVAFGLSYLVLTPNDPEQGLFESQSQTFALVNFTPSDLLEIGLLYARYYSSEPGETVDLTANTGSQFAQLPFGGSTATSANSLGIASSYKVSDRFLMGGWLTYTNAIAESSPRRNGFDAPQGADADIWSWAVTATLLDAGKKGDRLNFVFGVPSRLADNDIPGRSDRDASYHIELSYRYQATDDISIVPGILLITDPEHNDENDDIWIGLVRTTFRF